jgi:hypothetical protein
MPIIINTCSFLDGLLSHRQLSRVPPDLGFALGARVVVDLGLAEAKRN